MISVMRHGQKCSDFDSGIELSDTSRDVWRETFVWQRIQMKLLRKNTLCPLSRVYFVWLQVVKEKCTMVRAKGQAPAFSVKYLGVSHYGDFVAVCHSVTTPLWVIVLFGLS